MITNNSSEHFFSSVVKRVLVTLLCVPFAASSGLPIVFAAQHAPTQKRIATTSSKKRVALASRYGGADTNTESLLSTKSGAPTPTIVPITAPSWSELPPKPNSSRTVVIGNAKNSSRTVVIGNAKNSSPPAKTDTAYSTTTIKSDAKVVDAAAEVKEDADASADAKADVTPVEMGAVKTDPTTKTKAATKETAAVRTDTTAADTATAKTDAKVADTTAAVKTDAKVADTAAEVKTDAKVADTIAEVKTDAKAAGTVAEVKTEGSSTDTAAVVSGAADSAKLAAVPMLGQVSTNEPIVIDNDEAVEVESSIKYEDLPTDEGKTRVKTGAKFPVVISSQITTKTAKKGDPVEARLKYDLKIGDRLIAKKGAVVNGHINYSLPARSAMHSLVSATRWYRNSGCVGISFDEIINDKGEHLPLVAVPARAARIVKNKGEGRELGINHDGQVAGPWSQQLRYKALRIGLNAAMAPAGAFSFGAMPVALGIIGAANPSFAFMKPVGLNVRHRRIKGFFWGALSGVPGSWLIEDTVIKGQEAVIKPGDEFLAEFQQEFTGEPASEASMMPNANAKVHGQVMPVHDKKHKNKN